MELIKTIITCVFLSLTGIVPIMLHCLRLKRRNHFPLRLVAFIVLYMGIDAGLTLIDLTSLIWLQCLLNVTRFFVTCGMLLFLFDEKFLTAIFCCTSAKCTMHIAEYCSKIVFNFTIKSTIISLFIYAIVYVLIYFLFARKICSEDCRYLNNKKLILFSVLMITVTDVVVLYFNSSFVESTAKVYMFCFVTIICIVMLFLQNYLLVESKHLLEGTLLNNLREKERVQYESSKQTINLIAIRQHDLKNLLQSRTVALTQEERDEIGKLLESYDMPFNTGNRTLDVILMEKYLICKNKNIRLEVLVDGKAMDFFSEADLYSLFLNALNNAIESAEKLTDESKRVIWLKSYEHGSLLFIQVRNYYEKVLPTSYGYETTKDDKENHGFGLQSMKLIAEKYGGKLSIHTENNIFSLGIAIPTTEAVKI